MLFLWQRKDKNKRELATRELSKEHKRSSFEENKKIAKLGGHTAKVAKEDLERNLGKSVISSINSLNHKIIETKK